VLVLRLEKLLLRFDPLDLSKVPSEIKSRSVGSSSDPTNSEPHLATFYMSIGRPLKLKH